MPERQDKWRSIDTDTHIESLASEVCGHLNRLAAPEIEKYVQDEALRDLWLSGCSPGLTDFQRLMNSSESTCMAKHVYTLGFYIASVAKSMFEVGHRWDTNSIRSFAGWEGFIPAQDSQPLTNNLVISRMKGCES